MSKGIATLAVVLLLLFMAAAAVPTASADPGWDYYREIEINSGKVSGSQDLSSFPVLINHTADWLTRADSGDHVRQANGYDIVFTNADNSTKLDYEIEKYDGTAGTLVAWVRIPSLKYNENTAILLWYGNSAATDWSNPTGVWDTTYKGVWHLLGNDTTSLPDATSNSNTGTKKAAGEPANTTSGQIDGAQDFDGSNDRVDCGHDSSLNITDAITIEAWIYINDYGSSYPRIASKESTTSCESFCFLLWKDTHKLEFLIDIGSESPIKSMEAVPKDEWVHIAVTFDKPNGIIYINGQQNNTGSVDKSIPITANNLTIGSNNLNTRNFNGIIDEVRVSASARSGDWINTTYNNQNSPSTFYSVDATATGTGGTDPVPELPTAVLLAVGLVVLVGYVMMRRGKRR